MLDDIGLAATIEWQTSEFARESGIDCHVTRLDPVQLPDDRSSLAVFRVYQEALHTVVRGSGATHVDVSVESQEHQVSVRIISNGKIVVEHDLPAQLSLQYAAMRDRLLECHGTLTLSSDSSGNTVTEISVPLAQ